MTKKVQAVTTLSTKRFHANPKVVVGIVVALAAVTALTVLKGKLNASIETTVTDLPKV